MAGPEERLGMMRDMVRIADKLWSWEMGPEFDLMYSNSPDREIYYQLFMAGSSRQEIGEHFLEHNNVLIAIDTAGIAWIAEAAKEGGVIQKYHLLGPFFTVETTEEYLYRICSGLKVSRELIRGLVHKLEGIPGVSMGNALKYAQILHYVLTGEESIPDQVGIHNQNTDSLEYKDGVDYSYHGTWEAEQRFFKAIRDGDEINSNRLTEEFAHGVLGEMTEDPIRQLKDRLIIQVALCGRAAIYGGVSPDGSYSLQDYYIQRIEHMNSISALNDLSEEILQAFLRRSRQAKKSEGYPAAIRSAMEYINNHITEKISLKDLAAEVNYTEYYLSSKFKKEVGVSINTYIMNCKIDAAKELLGTGNYSICGVSDYLGFSSANYFGTVFKQYTGVTPTEFLAGGGRKAADSNMESR